MASALESLLLDLSDEQQEPQGILEDLHESYPLNLQAPRVDPSKHHELSQRMRIRKVRAALQESGIEVSGPEPAHQCQDAQIELTGFFNQHGNLKNGLQVYVNALAKDGEKDRDELLQMGQMVFSSCGFASVVNREFRLLVFPDGIGETELSWIELGLRREGVKGMSAEQAERWIMADEVFADHDILDDWHESGYSLAEAKRWVQTEIIDRHGKLVKPWRNAYAVGEWKSAGFDAERASHWARLSERMSRYSSAKAWIDAGITPGEAEKWLALTPDDRYYYNVFSTVKELRDSGLKAEQAKLLAESGVGLIDLADLVRWAKEQKVSIARLVSWCVHYDQLGGSGNIKAWHYNGFTPKQALAWCEVGSCWGRHNPFYNTGQACKWRSAGLEPEDARPWVKIHRSFANLSLVREWQEYGCAPSDAAPWARIANLSAYGADNILSPEEVCAWQELHPLLRRPEAVGRMIEARMNINQARASLQALGML